MRNAIAEYFASLVTGQPVLDVSLASLHWVQIPGDRHFAVDDRYMSGLVAAYCSDRSQWPPPIILGTPDRPCVRDGRHRLAAARFAGIENIPAVILGDEDFLALVERRRREEQAA